MVLFRRLLGDALRAQRMRRGMTLREVSAEARVSLGYISEIERGQKEASSELLASLCSALDLPLSVVLREVSDLVALEESLARDARRRRPRGRRQRCLRSGPQGAGWQAGHQYAARSRPAGPCIATSIGVPAAPARRPVAAVDPHPLALAQVAGGRLHRALLVEVEHLLGPSHQPGEVGHGPDRGRGVHPGGEAELGGVHVADAGQVGLVEERLADGRLGLAVQVGQRALLVPVGAEEVGAEVADDLVLVVAGDQLHDAEREPDGDGPGVGQHHAGVGGGPRPALARPHHLPAALHLEVGVQRPARVVLDPGEQVLAAGDGLDRPCRR